MNITSTPQYIENKNSEKIFPDIKDHYNYLAFTYTKCFEAQRITNNKVLRNVPDDLRAQQMILARVTDFIRSIQILTVKGYPEQATVLAASVFELAHTAVYFKHHPQKATKWLDPKSSIHDQMPKFLGVTWYNMVKENYKYLNSDFVDNEYKIYKQLCWEKHSLPIMLDMIIKDNLAHYKAGPYDSEFSINRAWFCMEHSGRLAEMIIGVCFEMELNEIIKIRSELHERAIKRFGTKNPFTESV